MGKKAGGWLFAGLVVLALFKCGDDKGTVPSSQVQTQAPAYAYQRPQPPAETARTAPSPGEDADDTSTEPEATPETLYVKGREVPLRASPNAKGKILNRLPSGMEVQEVFRKGAWVQVRHPISAQEGWISARRLSHTAPVEDQEEASTPAEPLQKDRPTVPTVSDAAIVARLIAMDASTYPGNCRCPSDTDRAGRRCGKRSAYSKPGGRSPLCYAHDVKPEMIANFRARRGR